MPVDRLQAAARYLQDFLRHPIGQRAPRQGTLNAAAQKLIGGKRETKFDQSAIRHRIAVIEPPAGQHTLAVIAAIDPEQQRDALGEAVARRTI